MNVVELGEKYNDPVVIALGFFDCIHKGHRLLVDTACKYTAKYKNSVSALFTFSNDPAELLGREKQIYSFAERANALCNVKLQTLIHTRFDKSFANISPVEFLDLLTDKLNIKAIVTGSDYTFGKLAKGNVEGLKEYCKPKNIEVVTVPFEEVDGHKVSTSTMKEFVKCGDVSRLNLLLSEPYFMTGKVIHARHVGTKLGFPTANIQISEDKLPLANGVYATVLQVGDQKYVSMTNVGAKPTFDINSHSIEAYILDFDGDIYNKTVKLSYIKRMRDIKKFATAEQLKAQLAFDENCVRDLIKL